ncbi:MAG: SoxR reducing system RseC family protein [Actinomycetota bacterium]|jgi:positive regulator of sigma E activity|nr:SoxR reducing system RseC family protein [Actinomycetota bacterium]
MRERGAVVSIHEGTVDLRMSPSGDCDSCGMCSGSSGDRIMEGVDNSLGARLGDLVEVETDPVVHLRAVVKLYLIPVMVLVVGYLAGFLLATWAGLDSDTVGAVVALSATAVTFRLMRRAGARDGGHGEKPRVRAIIARGHDGCESGY